MARAFPVVYSRDLARSASFWEMLGLNATTNFRQTETRDTSAFVRIRRKSPVTSDQWVMERYGLTMGVGPRFEMYVYVPNLDSLVSQLQQSGVAVLREPEVMPWGERIASVSDPDGNPVALCQEA